MNIIDSSFRELKEFTEAEAKKWAFQEKRIFTEPKDLEKTCSGYAEFCRKSAKVEVSFIAKRWAIENIEGFKALCEHYNTLMPTPIVRKANWVIKWFVDVVFPLCEIRKV